MEAKTALETFADDSWLSWGARVLPSRARERAERVEREAVAAAAEKRRLEEVEQAMLAEEEECHMLLRVQQHAEVHASRLAERNQAVLAAFKARRISQAECEARLAAPLVGGPALPPLPEERADAGDGMESLRESTAALSVNRGASPELSGAGLFFRGSSVPAGEGSQVPRTPPARMVAGASKRTRVDGSEAGPSQKRPKRNKSKPRADEDEEDEEDEDVAPRRRTRKGKGKGKAKLAVVEEEEEEEGFDERGYRIPRGVPASAVPVRVFPLFSPPLLTSFFQADPPCLYCSSFKTPFVCYRVLGVRKCIKCKNHRKGCELPATWVHAGGDVEPVFRESRSSLSSFSLTLP